MPRPWLLLTTRGKFFVVGGVTVVVVCLFAGQRDVLRLGLLLLILPILAGVLVARARLRMSCERSVEPAQVPLGSDLVGRIRLGQEGRLPIGILMLEDQVPRELGGQPRFLVDKADLRWHRDVDYPLRGRIRGRFHTGPLRVRTTDPFGLVQLDRQFHATSEVLITPEIHPLPVMRTAGGAGSTGEARPHRIGIVGNDDALIREYRYGDDMRRIHWRSTARRGEMMVRREEQAWDPSASVILDSRSRAHRGVGQHSSLEWAVSAAASIATHFLDDGFGIEIYDTDGPLHVAGTMGQHSSGTRDLVINRLTDLRPSSAPSLYGAVESATAERSGQLVVAILGSIGVADADLLVRVRRHRAQGLALVIDVDTFDGEVGGARRGQLDDAVPIPRTEADTAMEILRDHRWRVVRVPRGMTVAEAWSTLDRIGAAA